MKKRESYDVIRKTEFSHNLWNEFKIRMTLATSAVWDVRAAVFHMAFPTLRSSLFRLSLLTSSTAVTSACVNTLWGGVEMAQKEAHQRQGLRHTRHLRHRVRFSNQDDFRTSKQACQLVQCGNAPMHHLDKSHSTEEQMKSWPPLYVKSKWAAWDWPLANRQWNTRRASQLQWNGSPKRHRNRSCVWRSWWSERCEKKKEGHNVLFGAFSERKSIDVYSI